MPKYSGVPVWIGERMLVVPALSVMQIRAHRPVLSRYQTFGTQEPTDEELEKLIAYIKAKPGVWFATTEQIARYVKAQAA